MKRALPWAAALAALVTVADHTVPSGATFTTRTANQGTVATAGTWAVHDVQGLNAAGGTAGRLGTGDKVVLSYPQTPTAGPTTTVTISENGQNDTMALGGTLGTITLGADFVSNTVSFAGSVALSGNTVTITFGAQTGSSSRLRTAPAGTMRWTPGAGSTAYTESGPLDVDF